MQNRRDQVQAHSFLADGWSQRCSGPTRIRRSKPQRRFMVGWLLGLSWACLMIVACGVYGVVFPGVTIAGRRPGCLSSKARPARVSIFDSELRPVSITPRPG